MRLKSQEFHPTRQGLLADRRFQRVCVLFAIFTGFALRFYRLDSQELGQLEGAALAFRDLSVIDLVRLFAGQEEPLQPGSFWLQNLWHSLTGTSEFALRSISAFCSLLAVPLTYRFAKDLQLRELSALGACLLMALNAYAIWYTQDVLIYSLSLALSSASAALALRVISGKGGRVSPIAYAFCTAATFYTHVCAVLLLVVQNLYLLYLLAREQRAGKSAPSARPARPLLLRWTFSQLLTGALCAPWIASALPAISKLTLRGTETSLATALAWPFKGIAIGFFVPDSAWQISLGGIYAVTIIAAAVLGAVLSERRKSCREDDPKVSFEIEQPGVPAPQNEPARFPAHNPTLLLLLYVLVSLPFFWQPLYVFPFAFGIPHAGMLPSFLLLLVIGLGNIGDWIEGRPGRRWNRWVERYDARALFSLIPFRAGRKVAVLLFLVIVAGNMISLGNSHFNPKFSRSRALRELAGLLENLGAGLNPEEVRFAQYLHDPALWGYYYTGPVETISLIPWPYHLQGARDAVNAQRSAGVRRIILLFRVDKDLEDIELGMDAFASRLGLESPAQSQTRGEIIEFARQALASAYRLAGQETAGPWLVELYDRPDSKQWRLLDAEFASGLTLERAQVSPDFPPVGGRLVVHMEWSGDLTALTGGEKLFLHLLDESGNLVAQWDSEFRMDNGPGSTSVALPIPATLPAGRLRLIAGLYDVSVEGAPRILTASGEDSLLLVHFQVAGCDACGR